MKAVVTSIGRRKLFNKDKQLMKAHSYYELQESDAYSRLLNRFFQLFQRYNLTEITIKVDCNGFPLCYNIVINKFVRITKIYIDKEDKVKSFQSLRWNGYVYGNYKKKFRDESLFALLFPAISCNHRVVYSLITMLSPELDGKGQDGLILKKK